MKTQQPEQTDLTSMPDLPTTDRAADRLDAAVVKTTYQLNLNVPERFLLTMLLPQKGTRKGMAIAASIDTLIAFDEGEAILFGLHHGDDGSLFHNENGQELMTGFPLTQPQVDLIKQAVDQADADGRITRDMLPLLDKIDSL